MMSSLLCTDAGQYLVDGQVDSGVGYDAQQIGYVSLEKDSCSFSSVDFQSRIHDTFVLTGSPQRQSCLQDL